MIFQALVNALSGALRDLLLAFVEHLQEQANLTGDDLYTVIELQVMSALELEHFDQFITAAITDLRSSPDNRETADRLLDTLDVFIRYGGEQVPAFLRSLWLAYLFRLESASDALWGHYTALRGSVEVETGRELPAAWGYWLTLIHAFMGTIENHIMDESIHLAWLALTEQVFETLDAWQDSPEGPDDFIDGEFRFTPHTHYEEIASLIAYLNSVMDHIGRIDPRGYARYTSHGIAINQVFVPLRLIPVSAGKKPGDLMRYETATFEADFLYAFRSSLDLVNLEKVRAVSVQDALRSSPQIVILGPIGSGKTMLARHLALEHANLLLEDQAARMQVGSDSPDQPTFQFEYGLPVYIDLASYLEERAEGESLIAYTARAAASLSQEPRMFELLPRVAEDGQCLFLLDGLGQACTDEQRVLLIGQINDAVARWRTQGNRVAVTGQLEGYDALPLDEAFRAYVLRPLDRGNVSNLLLNWKMTSFRVNRPMSSDMDLIREAQGALMSLERQVSHHIRAHDLYQSPMILRMLAAQYHQGMILPDEYPALLQMLAEAMLAEWRLPQSASLRPEIAQSEIRHVLAGFARWLHHSRPTGLVTADELAAILRAIWGEMHPELDEDAIRDAVTRFILVLRSPDGPVTELMPGRYGFATSILQAFFAANYLVNSFRRAPKRIRERLHDPHWESVIQIAIGLVALRSREDASDLIEGAILARGRLAAEYDFSPSLYEPILHRDLFFAARLLARGIEPHPNLSNQIVSRLMQLWLLGDRDHLGRFTLLFDNARRHLVALQDLAASNRALQIALESLLSLDEHEAAFSADAATFWPIHISEKLNSLVAKGREEGVSVLVKRAVAAALGVIGQLTHPAYVLLMQYARDTNTEIRDSGQASLRKASPIPDESVKMWVDLLHDGHAANRRIALKILDQMGSLPGMVIGEMTSLLNDPDPDIRQGASRVLASVEDLPDSALLALCRAIDDADPRVQEAAIRALARPVYLPDEVIAQLIRWSRHPNIAIRRASVEALSISLNSAPPVLEALIERLKDVSDSITEYVIEPLAEKGKGEERVIASMMAIIGHLRYQIRRALARGLRHFPDQMEDKRQALLVLMSDREVIVRETVLDTVAEMTAPGHELLDYVISLVTLQQQGIASHAVHALSALRGLPVEGQLALVNALNVHWKAHGEAIARCLSEHRPLDMEVIDRLMDLAVLRGVGQAGRGESGSLRALALRILSSAQDERPEIGLLLQQAVSEIGNGDVQIAAIQGLARTRLMTPTIRASLMNVLQEGASTDVRCEAGIALGQLIHRLPDIPFTYSELLVLLDQIAGLLDELPRRASWEHHNRYQNLLMIALNWIAARTKDLPMRLPG